MGFKKGNMHYMSSLADSSFVTSGVFTPILLDEFLDPNVGQVYIKQVGRYTLIGGLLTFSLNLEMDDLGSLDPGQLGSAANIGNLPMTVGTGPSAQAVSGYGADLLKGNDRSLTARCVQGQTYMEMRLWADAANNRRLIIAELTRTSVLEFSGAYPI